MRVASHTETRPWRTCSRRSSGRSRSRLIGEIRRALLRRPQSGAREAGIGQILAREDGAAQLLVGDDISACLHDAGSRRSLSPP